MVIKIENKILSDLPESVEEFFDDHPSICRNNLVFTSIPHVDMWREEVLFIKQRQQATSDYRENKKVRWLGSHAAMTCHIAVMRHSVTGVVSIGHFDNFCCWQFGQESSAHKDGINIMLEEIGKKYICIMLRRSVNVMIKLHIFLDAEEEELMQTK